MVAAARAGAKQIPWMGNTLGGLWCVQGAVSELSSDPEPGQAHLSLPHHPVSVAACAPSPARDVPVMNSLGAAAGEQGWNSLEQPVDPREMQPRGHCFSVGSVL